MTLGLTRHRPGELPVEVTAFIGRRNEVADLTGLLRTARLVTVTGPGGVGKTRVALRAAAGHGDVCLVELSGLRDADLLPNTVAMCLGLPETESRSRLDAIIDHLRERRMLLILDTCEHLLDACAILADILLRTTTSVTVLATSRQPLDVPGEHALTLAPLPAEAAAELFEQCAAAVVPGFTVTDANRADVRKLCSWLDGVPLAIELAAVRLRALPLPQLAGRLEDRFRLLTGGRRSALAHHQTLHAATEWSYDLCTPAEQLLWARLAVFAGSFDVEAVEEICADRALPHEDVLATLIGLVDKSVVQRDDDRYWLLDTIREFGAEKLADGTAALRGRHIAHYLAVARRLRKADPASRGERGEAHGERGELGGGHGELVREQPNLRAALEYAFVVPGKERDAAAMTAALYASWRQSGALGEGRYWIGKVLDRFAQPSPERAWALVVDGYLASWQGELPTAVARLEAAAAMADEIGDQRAGCHAQMHLAMALVLGGRYDEAIAAAADAARRASATGDTAALATLDSQAAFVHVLSGEPGDGIARARLGLERIGTEAGIAMARSDLHCVLALGHILREEYQEGAAVMVTALTMKLAIGDILGMAFPLDGAAWIAAAQGRHARAAWILGAVDPVWRIAGGRLGRNPRLEACHATAELTARTALGEQTYLAIYRKGAGYPLAEIVRLVITEVDDLPELNAATGLPVRPVLTSREGEIAALVAEGLSNRAIAERLVISKRTVDAHIEHIFGKLGLSSRIQLVNWLQAELPAADAAGR